MQTKELYEFLKENRLLGKVAKRANVGRNTPTIVLLKKKKSRLSVIKAVLQAAIEVKEEWEREQKELNELLSKVYNKE